MPGGITSPYYGDALRSAVTNGEVSQARLTVSSPIIHLLPPLDSADLQKDMATRVLAAWYKLGQDNYPALNKDKDAQADHGTYVGSDFHRVSFVSQSTIG
jgi:hypothetical protein